MRENFELSINPYTNHVFFPSKYSILGIVILETLLIYEALARGCFHCRGGSRVNPKLLSVYRSHLGRVSEGNTGTQHTGTGKPDGRWRGGFL